MKKNMNSKEKSISREPILSSLSFGIGSLVKFNIISDDSDYASNCYGVEPQNDWFDVRVYIEECFGEIVKKNLIEIIYEDGSRPGIFYKIVNGIIKTEVDKLVRKKREYRLTLSEIFEGSGLRTMKDFKTIKILDFIPLKKLYKKGNCLLYPPRKPNLVVIWNKENIGYTYGGTSYYEKGEWIDNETKEVNKRIDEFSKWETSVDVIYIKGKIFVEDSGI